MDLYCTRCAEPYDLFSLTDDMTYSESEDFKAGRGCPCCCNTPDEKLDLSPRQKDLVAVQSALHGILGDDLDGLASAMEDFDALGGGF